MGRNSNSNGSGQRWVATGVCGLLCVMALSGRAGLVDFSANLLNYVEKRWGHEAIGRLSVWRRVVRDSQAAAAGGRPESAHLRLVNGFFNQVPYYVDPVHWGVEDYWATPIETLGSYGGNCKDYSIGKYMSLKEIGIPVSKLRMTYVRALKQNESHMVLAYYPTPDADPLILDNLEDQIHPASQRPDLEPVYSFNDDDLWTPGGPGRKGGAKNVRMWQGLLEKIAKEQAM